MKAESNVTGASPPGIIRRVVRVIAIIFASLLLLISITQTRKLGVPNLPVGWIYGGIAFAAVTLALQWPALYFRMPRVGRLLASAMLFLTIASFVVVDEQIKPLWEASPAGKKEAADSAERDRERAAKHAVEARDKAERESTQRILAEANASVERLKALNEKLEGCFSWGHRLPALENPVKESLHNPGAFEHVETIVTVPDAEQNNVVMRFRAENGFGALRTAEVRAQLVADDCSVQNIGQPSID